MGLFGKSDKEKEREEQARHEEARRKMQESLRRREQKAQAAPPKPAAAPRPAAPPAGGVRPAGVTPTAARPAAPAATSYTVAKGDSLSKIAKKHLGDANAWRKIYEANRAVIGDDPDKIFPGQKLNLPGGATRQA